MLSVARDFNLIRERTRMKEKKKKRKDEKEKTKTNKRNKCENEESSSIERRILSPRKGEIKKKGKKRGKRGTPEFDENVPSDREFLDATIYYRLSDQGMARPTRAILPREWPGGAGLAAVCA